MSDEDLEQLFVALGAGADEVGSARALGDRHLKGFGATDLWRISPVT